MNPKHIEIGFDPAPPGKYPLTKALVDSDFDGIVSGAILRVVYPEIEIFQGEATGMQGGIYNQIIDKHTVIVDLKYVPGCGLYFDHHAGNRPANDNFPGRWMDADSAARVVYEYHKHVADLSNFAEFIEEVDKFDLGKITLTEFLQPNSVIQMALSIDRQDLYFNALLIELLSKFKIQQVYNNNLIQKKIKRLMDSRESVFSYVRENGQVVGTMAFIDATDFKGEDKINGFCVTSQFPEVSAVGVFKTNKQTNQTKITFYSNEFRKDIPKYNLLEIAKSINPLAGGHISACGFPLNKDLSKDKVIDEVQKRLSQKKYLRNNF